MNTQCVRICECMCVMHSARVRHTPHIQTSMEEPDAAGALQFSPVSVSKGLINKMFVNTLTEHNYPPYPVCKKPIGANFRVHIDPASIFYWCIPISVWECLNIWLINCCLHFVTEKGNWLLFIQSLNIANRVAAEPVFVSSALRFRQFQTHQ